MEFFEFFISVVRGCSLNLSMSYREVRDSWFNFSIHLKCIFFISSFVLFQFGAGWEHALNFSNMSFLQPARIWKIYEELFWEKLKDEWSEVEWQQKWTRSEQSWWRKIFWQRKVGEKFLTGVLAGVWTKVKRRSESFLWDILNETTSWAVETNHY